MRLLLILPIIFYTHLLKAENENPFDEAESRLLEIIDFQRNGAIAVSYTHLRAHETR